MSEWPTHVTSLSIAAAQRRAVERQIASHVSAARDDGMPWSEIGAALGVSKQAAQQRYGRAQSSDSGSR